MVFIMSKRNLQIVIAHSLNNSLTSVCEYVVSAGLAFLYIHKCYTDFSIIRHPPKVSSIVIFGTFCKIIHSSKIIISPAVICVTFCTRKLNLENIRIYFRSLFMTIFLTKMTSLYLNEFKFLYSV